MIPLPDPDRSRLARALRALPRQSAPSELARSVHEALAASSASESTWEEPIGTLPRLRAPDVLARLVAEELANPAATAERFVGDLPRPSLVASSPEDSAELDRTIVPSRPSIQARRRSTLRAGLSLAAAAALVVWFGADTLLRSDRPAREFQTPFVWADSGQSLGPGARWVAGSLAGSPALAVGARSTSEAR